MNEWIFHFLSNVAIRFSDEQKQQIVDQLTILLRKDATGVIEITADDGTVIGFRSDSIVAWVSTGKPSSVFPFPDAAVHAG